jgi:hypothetical protein
VTARSAAARATARTTADRTAARSTASAPVRTRPTEPRSPARPDLRVVPPAPARRTAGRSRPDRGERRAPFVLLVVVLLVGTTLGLLFLNTAIAVDSLKASQLRAANAELTQEVQRLQQDAVAGGTPASLAAAAAAAGLVPAGSAAYLVIAPDGSSTLRGSATPAPEPVRPEPRRAQPVSPAAGD